MMKPLKIALFSLSCALVACETDDTGEAYHGEEGWEETKGMDDGLVDLGAYRNESVKTKVVKGIRFAFKTVSAMDFLTRNGKTPDVGDQADLENEMVLIFELEDTNAVKNIFEHPTMVFSKDQTVQYLCGDLMKDLSIEQENKVFAPNGVQYEGTMGAMNSKIRVLTFFSGVDLDDAYTIRYNDRIFDAGIVRIKQQTKYVPV